VLRSLGVLLFIGIVGATGVYFANRPTIAKGDVVAADLQSGNKELKSLQCDKQVPIGMTGATLLCDYEFHDGRSGRVKVNLDRAGIWTAEDVKIEKTADPWAQ